MQPRHDTENVQSSAWDDLQAELRGRQEVDRQMIAAGRMSNRSVAVFGVFDMERDITVNYRKMLGI